MENQDNDENSIDSTKTSQNTPVENPKVLEKSIPPLPSWPQKAKQQKGKRFPFDEAGKDPSLVEFRNQLYIVTLEKDAEKLMDIITDNIQFSFGGEYGKQEFIKFWELDKVPEQSGLWNELDGVLKLGGGFGDRGQDNFYAPYIYALDDIDDPYMEGVITGDNVRLRSSPDSKSEILGSMSWDLVEILNQENYVSETIGGESHVWQKVKTVDGQVGFVYEKYLRTPIYYRAGFSKKDGKWVMDMFIAGD